ncbi:MAG: hypothetical protein A2900_03265 [Candidatus Chisholmbacteria bacterium RIFCSPLOWO2_01_FULL_50_28]|uniref:Glycosyltransferase RgtA/B/C/D-like domain-containing protein n=1 Tax=Candidatus Chisholmbacteria bacterium RIFCSPHIGHO2_01_FULL_52_32 TaxID=1797591 RepID=A0A1G1VT00_9BACT|nr:MAG: hypothetical protein A2786_03480 [Candidatus Chisholmbacteria bacterium RIFCSPHIGHO2_01_FULL_52_32]OGY20096.1 MAG: hypothetical protein A2900_03265 [Candidatus Chisholmbacteria bacterium RIFCSPLOWO2_01_FULL_50_28]
MRKEPGKLKWILGVLVLWRVALLAIAAYAISSLPFKPSFPYWETLLEPNGHPLFWSWGNFDGVHYLTIAMHGYSAQFTQAFFPLYPLAIRYTQTFVGNYLASGLLVSHAALVITLILFYKLIRLDWGQTTAKRTLIFLLLFPTAYSFVSVYTESLFLMMVFGSLFAARKKSWWIAGILGGLASATRIFGVFLLPALLIEWYVQRGKKTVFTFSELFLAVLPIFLSISGLVGYMYYLNKSFQDPLLFLHAQPVFGAGRSADKLILLYQVFWRYVKMIATVDPKTLVYYTVFLEAASGILFLVLSIIAFRRTRLSYAIFGILSYLLPTLTGTFSSMPRYVLVLFPCFIVLGKIKSPIFQRVWWVASAILLAVNTALFVRGYWVA